MLSPAPKYLFEKTVLLMFFVTMFFAGCGRRPEYQLVEATGDVIVIPVVRVNDGDVHFFTYHSPETYINFFIRQDGSGDLHSHFDACYGCYKYKEGYVHEEGAMVCLACRLSYDLEDAVWDYIGACAPITLKSRIEGGALVIRKEHLERGSRFF